MMALSSFLSSFTGPRIVTAPNGSVKFQPRNSTTFRRSLKYVATIDFGTTHCSVAYILSLSDNLKNLKNLPALKPTLVALQGSNKRIPNCVLFSDKGEFLSLGFDARQRWADMEQPGYYYFDHVKKHLQHDESLKRETIVCASNGARFFLISVIAHILYELKEKLIKAVNDQGYIEIKATDFDWVITVPAFWKDRGKQMMREAGYMAGLCSHQERPPKLSIAKLDNPPQQPVEESPEKLSLALESEAAAIYCQHESKIAQQDARYCIRPNHYIVVDLGGGTVDIASHSIVEECVHEIVPSVGEDVGGTTVNEQFSLFLQSFVDDPGFSSYYQRNDCSSNEADMIELLFTRFEREKIRYGECADHSTSDDYVVALPTSFSDHYKEKLVAEATRNDRGDVSVRVVDYGRKLRISSTKMAEFFAPVIEKVSKLLEHHLTKDNGHVGELIDTIYWAGGFGRSEYLRQNVQQHLEKLQFHGKYRFPVIADAEDAVVLGATAFRCFPSIVRKRKADATYGVESFEDFVEGKHDKAHRSDLTLRDKVQCKDIFCTIVEKGDDINTEEVFVHNYVPMSIHQKSMTFTIFSTEETDVWYVDEPGVCKRGIVAVDMGGSGLARSVELVVDITHAELQVRAHDITSGKEKKVVVDFFKDATDAATPLST